MEKDTFFKLSLIYSSVHIMFISSTVSVAEKTHVTFEKKNF